MSRELVTNWDRFRRGGAGKDIFGEIGDAVYYFTIYRERGNVSCGTVGEARRFYFLGRQGEMRRIPL